MRSTFNCLIFCFFLFFSSLSLAGAEGLTVTVAEENTLPGPYITLGEVATISGNDNERIEALRGLKLGNAPFAGQSIILPMDVFGARLLNNGIDLSGINWQVPPYIKITAASQVVSGDTIAAEAKNYLLSQFQKRSPEDLIINIFGRQSDLILSPGQVSMNAHIPQGIRPGGTTTVDVGINVNGELKITAKVRFQVNLFEEVVVTAKPIRAGSALTLDNLKMERRNIAKNSSGSDYITDINRVLGLCTRRSLAAGFVLDISSLAKPTIVERSSEVTIIAQVGGIEVTAAGIAMQNGYEGQLIRVQNKLTKKMISAKIIDADTVKVLIH